MKRLVLSILASIVIVGVGLIVWAFRINNEEQLKASAEQLATEKTFDLIETNTWSHTSSNGDDFGARVYKSMAVGSYGEVLYRGICDTDFAMQKWIDSPTHNAIVSDKTYKGYAERTAYYNEDNCYIVRIYYK